MLYIQDNTVQERV